VYPAQDICRLAARPVIQVGRPEDRSPTAHTDRLLSYPALAYILGGHQPGAGHGYRDAYPDGGRHPLAQEKRRGEAHEQGVCRYQND